MEPTADTITGEEQHSADHADSAASFDATVAIRGRECSRTFELDDIAIRSGGDGRTVVAYAAVFDSPAEITDQEGHYTETINRRAFDKTLSERSGQVQVFYNHGKTIYGTPSERFSMPLGVPEEITSDNKGLKTVTRYNRNPLADEVLESIRNGDIRGQSFSGRWVPGGSKRTRGANGGLDHIERSEVALREYGPTPIPSYGDAVIVGVRMEDLARDLADTLAGLSPEDRAELLRLIGMARSIEPPTPIEEAVRTDTSDEPLAPVVGHAGPTPQERRQRVAALLP